MNTKLFSQRSEVSKLFLLFTICLMVFLSGCHKESLFPTQLSKEEEVLKSQTPTIKIEEAKEWFEHARQQSAVITQRTGSTLFLPNALADWQQAINDFSRNGKEFVIAPLSNDYQKINADAKLLIYKDSLNQLAGVFMLYIPDSTYFAQKHGDCDPITFTGHIIYTDFNGNTLFSLRVDNGTITKYLDATIESYGSSNIGMRSFPQCYSVHYFSPCAQAFTILGDCGFDVTFCGGGGGGGGGLSGVPGTFGYDGGGGGGGTNWGNSQPNNLFNTDAQLKAKLSVNAWGIIRDNNPAKSAAKRYLNKRGEDNVNAIENNIDLADSDLNLFQQYLGLSTDDDAFFNANQNLGFPASAALAFKRYTNAGFTTAEIVKLFSIVVFQELNEFLSYQNDFSIDFVKDFLDQTGNDPVFQIDGELYSGKFMVYSDRIVRKLFNKTQNRLNLHLVLEAEVNKFIQTSFGKRLIAPDGLWNQSKYDSFLKLVKNIWEDHFEASAVSIEFYNEWQNIIINAPTNTETAYYMQQRGVNARYQLERFNLVIENVIDFFGIAASYRPTIFNTNGRVFKLNYAPQRGILNIEGPLSEFSPSEIKSAKYMQNLGKNTTLRQPQGSRAADGNTSDLVIDGKSFDVYTPETSDASRIITRIFEKNDQAKGVVLDLSKSNVNPSALGDVMARLQGKARVQGYPLNIEEVYIINTNFILN